MLKDFHVVILRNTGNLCENNYIAKLKTICSNLNLRSKFYYFL